MQIRTGEKTAYIDTGANKPYGKALSVCAKKCRVSQFRAYNKSAAEFYLQLHDSSGPPSDMTTCRGIAPVFAKGNGGEGYTAGIPLLNGAYLYASQSDSALVPIAADDALITAIFVQERS